MIGVGGSNAQLAVYIGNRPPLPQFAEQKHYRGLEAGEIAEIARLTGNHWRKIFNCYAKLVFSINRFGFKTWQAYRDQQLLQHDDHFQLLFSPPRFSRDDVVYIVSGKQYFESLSLAVDCDWLDGDFAIAKSSRLIVCPYFDYRQLSNRKIEYLATLISSLR